MTLSLKQTIFVALLGLTIVLVGVTAFIKRSDEPVKSVGLGGRTYLSSYAILNGVTATTTSSTLPSPVLARDYNHVVFAVDTSGSANATIKFVGSITDAIPDPTQTQSATNQWDYVEIIDLEDGASLDGDTGLVLSGTDDHRIFAVNVDNLHWVMPIVTSYTTGTISVQAAASTND